MVIYNTPSRSSIWGSTACLVWLFSSSTTAAPLIQNLSGTVTHNNTITLTGTGFGSNALDLEWTGDAIEAGALGNNFSKSGWNNNWGWENAKYATDQRHSNSKSLKCVPLPATSWNCAFSYKLPNPVTAGQTLYMTWWVRKDSASNTGQWKMLRLSGNETIMDGSQQMTLFNWPGSQYQLVVDPSTSNDQSFWLPSNVFPNGDNSWYRMELMLKASGTGQTNGSATVSRYDGSAFNTYSTSLKTHTSSGSTYSYVIFQNYEGNGMSSSALWFDDILIQKGSPARIEICNRSTWSSRNHCEVQVPTAWSTGSISFSTKLGAFGIGQTAYLYVIDSGGAVSSSFPITIGSTSGGTSTLGSPNNLRLINQ